MLTEPHILTAYLYMHLADQMPQPILNDEGEVDVDADNAVIVAWSEGTDPIVESLQWECDRIEYFITRTEQLLHELENLIVIDDEPVAPQYMTLFYDAAKDVFDHDKTKLRTYFLWLYLVIFQRPDGPRWGEFVEIYGVEGFVRHTVERFGALL